eukprot:CAMPEP_0204564258 /NCGR_PEP_ID=MMETSP0661-20131031/34781_1 /ASSEMBLY_ACC=CAM_ASM_000606 /TAXON_ID=109239 /ORGANISM="Alexandrium margalefi, Strain AMGDE01CS-322" /LENGTH=118 /DNA_ID=CAMNT_0051571887 /DNA_START=79 /DNA_END=435 /DNA_ORIENTATION=-
MTARLRCLRGAHFGPLSLATGTSATGLAPGAAGRRAVLGLRGFCAAPAAEVPKPKVKTATFGSRLRSFAAGFAIAGTLSGYALFFKVQLASEELAAAVREAAYRQSQIERRLTALEKR